MCFAVYISSDVELSAPAQQDWTQEKSLQSFIYLCRLTENDKEFSVIREKLVKPYLYYVGSNQGCGCGLYGFDLDLEEESDKKIREGNYQMISLLLQKYSDKNFEIFTCWEGDQWKAPEKKIKIRKNDLMRKDFLLEELYFYTVSK